MSSSLNSSPSAPPCAPKHYYLTSSIGKKQVMALTGLLLCGFLVTHLLGNFLIFVGPQAFNTYAHTLTSNPLILFMELALGSLFLGHIVLGLKVTMENQKARPQGYYMKVPTGRGASFASTSMPYTGLIVLIFLVLHLIHFRFGQVIMAEYGGVAMRDLHSVVMAYFTKPLNVAWYIVAQIALGIHLSHGFSSAFGTLGFHHPRYTPIIQKIGYAYALAMALGFSSIPIWAYLQGGR